MSSHKKIRLLRGLIIKSTQNNIIDIHNKFFTITQEVLFTNLNIISQAIFIYEGPFF